MNPIQPAIVRQNVRSIQSLMDCCANGYRATVAQAETWLLNHEELHKRYKEKFTTWDEACMKVYGVHRQAVHKRVTQICDRILSPTGDNLLDRANAEVPLNIVEKPDLSCVPAEVRDAVAEHIHDAHKPEIVPQRTARVENGKPKSQLEVWKNAMNCGGAFLRAVDDVRRDCGEHPFHDQIISSIKREMDWISQWQSKV